MTITRTLAALALAGAVALSFQVATTLSAQQPNAFGQPQPGQPGDAAATGDVEAPAWAEQRTQLLHASVRLPLAAALACVLALRPKRRGTPARNPSVIQTQIILAIVGAVVMLVVGASLARAFGIVGAAGLVRYRAKIDDPKDAGVMLSTLAIGLAAGVGMFAIAVFTTMFVLAVLWIVESVEKAKNRFILTIQAADPAALHPKVHDLLTRQRIEFDMRTTSEEELSYEVSMPIERKTDRLSAAIQRIDPEGVKSVEFEEKKAKK